MSCGLCGGPVKAKGRRYCSYTCANRAMGYPTQELLEAAFWAKVDKSGGQDACWPWTGSIRWDGYGRTNPRKRQMVSHRYAYEIVNGPLAAGLCVLHTCDNPPCCNPKHLRAGTHGENMQDMRVKTRTKNQLKPEVVQAIRAAPATVSHAELARQLGVNATTVCQIRLGQKYKFVPDRRES